MKSKLLSFAALAAMMAGFASCSDDTWTPDVENGDGEGVLNTASVVASVLNEEYIVSESKGPASRSSVTVLDDYLVSVTDASGREVESWTFSTMPSMPVFNVGTYKITVRSHEVNPAAWEEPYFVGSQSFSIVKDQVTDVEKIVCVLSNIRVSVNFDEKLLAVAGDDVKVTVTSADNHSLEFPLNESRSGYFAAIDGLQTLALHFTGTIRGNYEDFTKVISDVKPGQHRKVTFKLVDNGTRPPEEVGTIVEGDGVNVSSDVESVDLTSDTPFNENNLPDDDRPGKEEEKPVGPDDPQPPVTEDAIKFTSETMNLEGANEASEFGEGLKEASVHITATEGFKNLKVKIISDFLTREMLDGVGLTDEFDLANPVGVNLDGETVDYSEALRGINLPVGDEVVGKTELDFNITQFVPLIFEAGDHKFEITVVDQKGTTKSMILLIHKS